MSGPLHLGRQEIDLIDRFVTRQIDSEILQKMLPDWVTIQVAQQHPLFDPAIEAAIRLWVTQNCHGRHNYDLGVGLFADRADAALFRLFWG